MALYINGTGNISPQQTWNEEALRSEFLTPSSDRFPALEPDHSQFIDAKSIRRMSRIIKMGVSASAIALRDAAVAVPDAIITGTAYGCLEDTGVFLTKMIENNEEALNPTPFIQSTHNTIGSQIALLLQCQGYNQTYSQGAFSFENVLLDALIQADDSPERKLLLGAIDEITDVSHGIQKRFGLYRSAPHGEGAHFFVTSGLKQNAIAKIDSVATSYRPTIVELKRLLKESGSQFDLVLFGGMAEQGSSGVLSTLDGLLSPDARIVYFKNLCGEYPTASGFALWLATAALKDQSFCDRLTERNGRSVDRVLIVNEFFDIYYSTISVSRC